MGFLWRTFAPRPLRRVRRLAHPVGWATPRPVRRAGFAAWSVRHPVRRAETGVRRGLYRKRRARR